MGSLDQDTSLCMTPRVLREACTVGILAKEVWDIISVLPPGFMKLWESPQQIWCAAVLVQPPRINSYS